MPAASLPQTSTLLSMPSEIRLNVYRHLFQGLTLAPLVKRPSQLVCPNLNVFRTCRQCYEESQSTLFHQASIKIDHIDSHYGIFHDNEASSTVLGSFIEKALTRARHTIYEPGVLSHNDFGSCGILLAGGNLLTLTVRIDFLEMPGCSYIESDNGKTLLSQWLDDVLSKRSGKDSSDDTLYCCFRPAHGECGVGEDKPACEQWTKGLHDLVEAMPSPCQIRIEVDFSYWASLTRRLDHQGRTQPQPRISMVSATNKMFSRGFNA